MTRLGLMRHVKKIQDFSECNVMQRVDVKLLETKRWNSYKTSSIKNSFNYLDWIYLKLSHLVIILFPEKTLRRLVFKKRKNSKEIVMSF